MNVNVNETGAHLEWTESDSLPIRQAAGQIVFDLLPLDLHQLELVLLRVHHFHYAIGDQLRREGRIIGDDRPSLTRELELVDTTVLIEELTRRTKHP